MVAHDLPPPPRHTMRELRNLTVLPHIRRSTTDVHQATHRLSTAWLPLTRLRSCSNTIVQSFRQMAAELQGQ
jgi:hypothetical protein